MGAAASAAAVVGSQAAVAAVEAAVHPAVGKFARACGWPLVSGHWRRSRHFNAAALDRLAVAIAESETHHPGELLVVLETHLPDHVPDGATRALEVFGRQRVWDTPQRTGMLLYIALGNRCIELIADRGIDVPDATWDGVCHTIQEGFRRGDYIGTLETGIDTIEAALKAALPAGDVASGDAASDPNRLPDRPVFI
ncbi:membrane protein [Pigmentiphaga litoralis]|nr:membrane protein [Pigmentiphaga litoralis]